MSLLFAAYKNAPFVSPCPFFLHNQHIHGVCPSAPTQCKRQSSYACLAALQNETKIVCLRCLKTSTSFPNASFLHKVMHKQRMFLSELPLLKTYSKHGNGFLLQILQPPSTCISEIVRCLEVPGVITYSALLKRMQLLGMSALSKTSITLEYVMPVSPGLVRNRPMCDREEKYVLDMFQDCSWAELMSCRELRKEQ
jgi:hypothetical protein